METNGADYLCHGCSAPSQRSERNRPGAFASVEPEPRGCRVQSSSNIYCWSEPGARSESLPLS